MKRKFYIQRFNRWRRNFWKKPPRPLSREHIPKYGVARRQKKSRIPRKYMTVCMLLLIAVAFVYNFYRFDRLILPMVLEAEELRLQAEINNIINYVIQEIIRERNIVAEDFLIQSQPGGTLTKPVLSVNTVLVNEICNAAAQLISQKLNNLEPEIVSVPMGMALNLDTFAQSGPTFNFSLAPIGNALVNYESAFSAVGINQTHFAVWLTVESVVRIINPVHSSEIIVVRNVSLVDTVMSGVVPDTYFNMDVPNVQITP